MPAIAAVVLLVMIFSGCSSLVKPEAVSIASTFAEQRENEEDVIYASSLMMRAEEYATLDQLNGVAPLL